MFEKDSILIYLCLCFHTRWSCRCRSRLWLGSRGLWETQRKRSAPSKRLWPSRRTSFTLVRWSAGGFTIPSRSSRQVTVSGGLGYLAREMLVLFSSFFLFDYFCTFEEMWVVNNQREDAVDFATTKLICHSCHTGKHPGLLQSAPIGGWRPQQTHPAPSQRRQDNNTRQNRGGENPVSIPDL